jgi:hypothetical protein
VKDNNNSILIIGESGVGKTHYGAQLLMRLQHNSGQLSMDGAASNLEPFSEAMDRLNEGRAANHTPVTTYVESVWPVKDSSGCRGELVWPDYGGEQIFKITTSRNIPSEWLHRVTGSSSWIFMIRHSLYRLPDDILSKPSETEHTTNNDSIEKAELSDQSRLVELLQILLYLRKGSGSYSGANPKVCFLLSCWDELNTDLSPSELLIKQLPMLSDFIHSHWEKPLIMGLSALGQSLDMEDENDEYISSGPEKFGYVVHPDGKSDSDITLPIKYLID